MQVIGQSRGSFHCSAPSGKEGSLLVLGHNLVVFVLVRCMIESSIDHEQGYLQLIVGQTKRHAWILPTTLSIVLRVVAKILVPTKINVWVQACNITLLGILMSIGRFVYLCPQLRL